MRLRPYIPCKDFNIKWGILFKENEHLRGGLSVKRH